MLAHRIFDLLDQDKSQRESCRIFMAEGLKPPRGCRACRKAKAVCRHWNAAFISKVGHEEFYVTGIWYYNKRRGAEPAPERIRTKGPRHRQRSSWAARPRSEWMECYRTEAIVDRALFDRVQMKLPKNKSLLGGRPSDRFTLTSMGKCKICGGALTGWTKGKNSWYRCCNRDRVHGHRLCDQKSIRAAPLEETIRRAVTEEIGDERRLRAHIAAHRQELIEEVDTGEVEQIRARAAKLRAQMHAAADKELDEEDPGLKERHRNRVKDLRPQVAFLEGRLRNLESASKRSFEVNIREVAEDIRAGFRTQLRSEIRTILRHWIVEFRYADGEVEITVRVPLKGASSNGDLSGGEGGNCKRHVGEIGAGEIGPVCAREHQQSDRSRGRPS